MEKERYVCVGCKKIHYDSDYSKEDGDFKISEREMKDEIVKVKWIDAQRLELGVLQKEEFSEIEPLPCEIVGFKIYENEKWITIAQEKWSGPLGGAKYVHIIPKVSIIKITELKDVEEEKK